MNAPHEAVGWSADADLVGGIGRVNPKNVGVFSEPVFKVVSDHAFIAANAVQGCADGAHSSAIAADIKVRETPW